MARIVTDSYPDFVRMSFSSQQQSCWVFQDAFINRKSRSIIHRWRSTHISDVFMIVRAKLWHMEFVFLRDDLSPW